jgi:hypothetical protein
VPNGRKRPAIVRVMFEWNVDDPLWDGTPGGAGPLRAEALGVSADLAARLRAWSAEMENHAPTGPESFAWPSADIAADWRHRGFNLARELQQDLGPDVEVRYRHDGTDRPALIRPGS